MGNNSIICWIIFVHRGEGSLQTTEDLFEASQVSKTLHEFLFILAPGDLW